LPFMIVIWLISMNIFHSPANSMLELFAPAKELPSAMALMVITTDLLYAFENKVVDFVDWIGPVSTFALGGLLLILTGYFFKRSTRSVSFVRDYEEVKEKHSEFGKVLLAGLLLGSVTTVIKNLLPEWIEVGNNSFIRDSSWFVTFILVVAALAAWPLSNYIKSIGTNKALNYGLVGTLILLGITYLAPDSLYLSIPLCIGIGLMYSLTSVSAFPLALSKLSPQSVTLGAGAFFGSAELADGVLNIWASL
ncbi:MAG: hypothetical protein L0Y35_05985, partial [Flammeovirgaceae bacterium]|nr:hypothetical protein [Flammeovirgaceae bacterium]